MGRTDDRGTADADARRLEGFRGLIVSNHILVSSFANSDWGPEIEAEVLPHVLFCDDHAVTCWQFPGLDNYVTYSEYPDLLSALQHFHSAGVIAAYEQGNIGKFFPETFLHYNFNYLTYTPDPSVIVEVSDDQGRPYVISKKIANGLLVISALWEFRDDAAQKTAINVPLLGLNAFTREQLLAAFLDSVRVMFDRDVLHLPHRAGGGGAAHAVDLPARGVVGMSRDRTSRPTRTAEQSRYHRVAAAGRKADDAGMAE